jgi:ribosomal protein L28
VGNSRSHSNIATKRRQLVNLQPRTIGGQKVRLCTRCIRMVKTAKVVTPAKPVAKKTVKKATKKA